MSDLPEGARFEGELAGGVALYDVSHLLPRRRHPRGADKRPARQRIERVYIHHSGALGAGGYQGARNATRYVFERREPRGFPGAPYHYWCPHDDVRDPRDRMIVFRLAEDSYRCWSQGAKANDHGVSVCLQGDLTETGMSDYQEELLEALLPWLIDRHSLRHSTETTLSMHSEASQYGGRSKPTCPSPLVEEWIRAYRLRARA